MVLARKWHWELQKKILIRFPPDGRAAQIYGFCRKTLGTHILVILPQHSSTHWLWFVWQVWEMGRPWACCSGHENSCWSVFFNQCSDSILEAGSDSIIKFGFVLCRYIMTVPSYDFSDLTFGKLCLWFISATVSAWLNDFMGFFESFSSVLPSKRKKIMQLLLENICLPKIKKESQR